MSKIILSFVLAFVLFVAFYEVASEADIEDICREAEDPGGCLTLLDSSPGGTDLVSLGQYTIDVVRANMTNTITLLKSLIAKSGDPKKKAHYNDCLKKFDSKDGAVGDIDDTQKSLKKGDYVSMSSAASALSNKVDKCIYVNSGVLFPDPSPLPKYGRVMGDIISIILVISDYLRGA